MLNLFKPNELFIERSYIRVFKKKYSQTDKEAKQAFDIAVRSGKIEYVKEWNGVKIYKTT